MMETCLRQALRIARAAGHMALLYSNGNPIYMLVCGSHIQRRFGNILICTSFGVRRSHESTYA